MSLKSARPPRAALSAEGGSLRLGARIRGLLGGGANGSDPLAEAVEAPSADAESSPELDAEGALGVFNLG